LGYRQPFTDEVVSKPKIHLKMWRLNTAVLSVAAAVLSASPTSGYDFLNPTECYQANGAWYFVSTKGYGSGAPAEFFRAAQNLFGPKSHSFTGTTWTYLDDTACTQGVSVLPSGTITTSVAGVNDAPCTTATGLVKRWFIMPSGSCGAFASDLSALLYNTLSNVRSRGSQSGSVYCPNRSGVLASAAESNAQCAEMARRINVCLSNPSNEWCVSKKQSCSSFQCPYGSESKVETGSCYGTEGCDRYQCCSTISTADCMDYDCAAYNMVPAFTASQLCLVEGCSKWHCCTFE
jgi:hypothetical protein